MHAYCMFDTNCEYNVLNTSIQLSLTILYYTIITWLKFYWDNIKINQAINQSIPSLKQSFLASKPGSNMLCFMRSVTHSFHQVLHFSIYVHRFTM